MIINSANLRNLTTSYRANFMAGLGGVPSLYKLISTEIPSSTARNLYPWLKNLPGMREWIGARVIRNLEAGGYELANRKFEATVGVKGDDIRDDTFGTYAPMMRLMGEAAGRQPDELIFAALAAGFSTNCFDGQFFFDTDHPVLQADGTEISVSNMQAGASPPWYLMDLGRYMKPLIFQNRKAPTFVAKENPEDDRVFEYDEFTYGVDSRNAAGYGFWQLAFGSKATLNVANFEAAYDAMTAFKGDNGQKLGVKPTHLLCGTANRAAAEAILKKANLTGGESNLNLNRVELVVSSWLD